MRQTPTFSMSNRMVQAIAQAAGRRGDSMSAVVRAAVRAYISLDDDDRPLRSPSRSVTAVRSQAHEPGGKQLDEMEQ